MSRNIVAYYCHEQDAGNVMFGPDAPLPRCTACGSRLDLFAHNPDYELRRSKYDLYGTYDGQAIVSAEFRRFCDSHHLRGLEFREFSHDKDHFHLIVKSIVPFDAKRARVRFDGLCSTCGQFWQVIIGAAAFAAVQVPLKEGIYRTDLAFAAGDERSPCLLVAPMTKKAMEAARLRIVFSEVEGLPPKR